MALGLLLQPGKEEHSVVVLSTDGDIEFLTSSTNVEPTNIDCKRIIELAMNVFVEDAFKRCIKAMVKTRIVSLSETIPKNVYKEEKRVSIKL